MDRWNKTVELNEKLEPVVNKLLNQCNEENLTLSESLELADLFRKKIREKIQLDTESFKDNARFSI